MSIIELKPTIMGTVSGKCNIMASFSNIERVEMAEIESDYPKKLLTHTSCPSIVSYDSA